MASWLPLVSSPAALFLLIALPGKKRRSKKCFWRGNTAYQRKGWANWKHHNEFDVFPPLHPPPPPPTNADVSRYLQSDPWTANKFSLKAEYRYCLLSFFKNQKIIVVNKIKWKEIINLFCGTQFLKNWVPVLQNVVPFLLEICSNAIFPFHLSFLLSPSVSIHELSMLLLLGWET